MLRRLLLAVLLCLSAWVVVTPVSGPDPDASPVVTAAPVPSETSDDARRPDGVWSAPQPLTVTVDSVASTRDPHVTSVELPRVSPREHGRLTAHRHAWRQPTPSVRPHLHDIPLLI